MFSCSQKVIEKKLFLVHLSFSVLVLLCVVILLIDVIISQGSTCSQETVQDS